jgi:hypothetical protein
MPEQNHDLLNDNDLFALQHVIEAAKGNMPPEALGHVTRAAAESMQAVANFAADRLALED